VARPPRSSRGGSGERNSLLTRPSLARQRGHSSNDTVGVYTVSLQVGQFR
jgi:hypothetical protein